MADAFTLKSGFRSLAGAIRFANTSFRKGISSNFMERFLHNTSTSNVACSGASYESISSAPSVTARPRPGPNSAIRGISALWDEIMGSGGGWWWLVSRLVVSGDGCSRFN